MKVKCIREGSKTTGFPDELLPQVGQIYTVINVKMGPKFEECDIWYELEELGVNVHTYRLFETVKEDSIKITKVSAMDILKLKSVFNNELGKF